MRFSSVRKHPGRLLARRALGTVDLSTLSSIPAPLAMPLRRNGIDPVEELAKARESGPVFKLASWFGLRVWMVSGLVETRSVLADATNFSTDIRAHVGRQDVTGSKAIGGLGFTDPPEHTRLRRFLTPEFTRRRLARLQPKITEIVEDQLDAMEAAGPTVDLVSTFAFPIPFLVICDLLGLPSEDRERFRHLGSARFDVSRGGLDVFGAMSQSRDFLIEAAGRQRSDPGDGLIGALIREFGDEVDDDELGGLADGVFTGGYETSASMISLGALTLLRNPDSMASLRTDDACITPIIDELLRYLSVVQVAFPRFARHDMRLFGKKIRAGDVVLCSLSGADRDPALGPERPDDFDPTRQVGSHLAFGYGFHRCVGAELARMELSAAIPGLARRFPDLSLAVDPGELQFRDLSIVYGIDSLPVRLH
jgi:cytochrome P450